MKPTQEQVIAWAREAGFESHDAIINYPKELQRFAAIVAAAEREACAAICDAYGMPDGTSETARLLAHQIRARRQICAE